MGRKLEATSVHAARGGDRAEQGGLAARAGARGRASGARPRRPPGRQGQRHELAALVLHPRPTGADCDGGRPGSPPGATRAVGRPRPAVEPSDAAARLRAVIRPGRATRVTRRRGVVGVEQGLELVRVAPVCDQSACAAPARSTAGGCATRRAGRRARGLRRRGPVAARRPRSSARDPAQHRVDELGRAGADTRARQRRRSRTPRRAAGTRMRRSW